MVSSVNRTDLLIELRRLAAELEKPPTAREMKEHGRFSITPYYREFGSWNNTLQAIDLDVNHEYNLNRNELLTELSTLSDELGYPPTREDMIQFGQYSGAPYYRAFESWNEALRACDLDVNHHRDASKEELLAEIRRLSARSKPPGRIQMSRDGDYSPQAYYTKFGSWTEAVRKAGFEPRAFAPGNRREYDYGDGWDEEKREYVRARDNRECQHCGMSEQRHQNRFGERLHVHHLVPAEAFDSDEHRNDVRNLVALCRLHHRTWEAADDYCPLDRSLPDECGPADIDPYTQCETQ